ncbi:MAG: response regulator [Acidobacteria bacterium]|nr:MAG: response regulator [Acidobacteriota bacterium]REK10574.1 MAG: response regulator [Acidobacteriota bacterium]
MIATAESIKGLRALVVEDEILIAEELRERLAKLGLGEIEVVHSGERAVEAARRQGPHMILMDIRLRGEMDGIEAARTIRQFLDSPVVYLTAHSDPQTVARAKDTSPFGYILKPFDERELAVTLELSWHRHQLERELAASERRYAATLASIGDGVLATDSAGRIELMNRVAEGLTGWSQDEAMGRPVGEVVRMALEGSGEPVEQPISRALRERVTVHLEAPTLLLSRSGQPLPIDDSAAPIVTDEGELLGAVLAMRDVSRRRLTEDALEQAEMQLRQAQKMEAVGRLAGGVAHDFNNLLFVINGVTELLLAEDGLEGGIRSSLEEVRQAGVRAASLTRQLLAFSRRQVVQPAAVHPGELVQEMSRLLQRLLAEDVRFVTRCDADLRSVWVDPGQLEQVVMNLVVNARDAMAGGGELAVECSNHELGEAAALARGDSARPGRYVRLRVTDTGKGMTPEAMERAFEPFFTTKAEGEGTGLGLSTVYGIVQQAGGFVDLQSELGVGTAVDVYLPAVALQEGTVHDRLPVSDSPGGSETILLVEDAASVRSMVAHALRRHGYTVVEAADGAEALALFDGAPGVEPDLLLTDVVMPEMSGSELAARVLERRPATRVLYLSGHTEDAVVLRGVDRGEVVLLQKPLTLSRLVQQVRQVLDT